MIQSVCVYCGSSEKVDPGYFELAQNVGQRLAQAGQTLVYGGGNVGLMGALARSVKSHGGIVKGVIPDTLMDREIAYEDADEMTITTDMRARKAKMEHLADAFLALPGGFGTLEELMEILTLKALATHDKPVVIFNADGFYDRLIELFEEMLASGFARPRYRALYEVVTDVDQAMAAIC